LLWLLLMLCLILCVRRRRREEEQKEGQEEGSAASGERERARWMALLDEARRNWREAKPDIAKLHELEDTGVSPSWQLSAY